MKEVTKTIKNETKEPKGGFLIMLLGTLGASLLRYLLAGKGIVRAGSKNKKKKELEEMVMEKNEFFNVVSSLNKLWSTNVLWEWNKI